MTERYHIKLADGWGDKRMVVGELQLGRQERFGLRQRHGLRSASEQIRSRAEVGCPIPG
jgi:hypothetical protein